MESNRFAVKVIEFADDEQYSRERIETEKCILTKAFHKNIVSIRMIINMGEIRPFPFEDDPSKTFLSPDRIYMIMDFADGGELELYLDKKDYKLEPALRLNFIRDLFFGQLTTYSSKFRIYTNYCYFFTQVCFICIRTRLSMVIFTQEMHWCSPKRMERY